MGLLNLGIDPEEELRRLRQAFEPSEDEKRSAQTRGLLAAGLGMLATPRRNQWQGIANAAMGGMGMYDQALQSARAQNMQGLQLAGTLQELKQRQMAMQQQQELRALQQKFAIPGQPASDPQYGPPTEAKPAGYDYAGLANAMAAINPMQALDLQMKLRKEQPEVQSIRSQTNERGEPIDVIYFKDGSSKVVPYGTAREMIPIPQGDRTTFADKNRIPTGAEFPMNLSPEGRQTGAHQQETFAETVKQNKIRNDLERARLGLSQSEFAYRKDKDAQEQSKPQIVTGPNGEVFSVDAKSGTGRPVVGPDGQPMSKGDKPLTEAQAKASVYQRQMLNAAGTLADLEKEGFKGEGRMQQGALNLANSYTNILAPANAQKFTQARRQWTEGYLRFKSGAQITPAELDEGIRTYFPTAGDGPDVIAQKAQMRAAANADIGMAAGHGRVPGAAVPAKPSSGGLSKDELAELERLRAKYGKR